MTGAGCADPAQPPQSLLTVTKQSKACTQARAKAERGGGPSGSCTSLGSESHCGSGDLVRQEGTLCAGCCPLLLPCSRDNESLFVALADSKNITQGQIYIKIMVNREKQGKTNLIKSDGRVHRAIGCLHCPRKVQSCGAEGNRLACIPIFPKNSQYNTSNLQGCWEQTNKQTTPSEVSPYTHASLVIF